MPPKAKKSLKKSKKPKKISHRFVIDCKTAIEDDLMDEKEFTDFLKARIKVNKKTGQLGDNVQVSRADKKVTVQAKIPMSKRYLKYLSKKFLKKKNMRDFLRVVASSKNEYELRYFNVANDGDDD
ncbi:Ribosomal protein L22e [Oopsacas minuta]|uniref:Large ribosomal subunit protein eL22 n=1 Tax=Oopsacas minuta TaxID=111878 RepID=A0AAV7KHE2_9METZ|nr:Ribosomal protein L22e [Oopsacas minuta]